jgi:hypothetical protein
MIFLRQLRQPDGGAFISGRVRDRKAGCVEEAPSALTVASNPADRTIGFPRRNTRPAETAGGTGCRFTLRRCSLPGTGKGQPLLRPTCAFFSSLFLHSRKLGVLLQECRSPGSNTGSAHGAFVPSVRSHRDFPRMAALFARNRFTPSSQTRWPLPSRDSCRFGRENASYTGKRAMAGRLRLTCEWRAAT